MVNFILLSLTTFQLVYNAMALIVNKTCIMFEPRTDPNIKKYLDVQYHNFGDTFHRCKTQYLGFSDFSWSSAHSVDVGPDCIQVRTF